MTGPQFLTPQPVYRSRPRQRFTLQQANRTLPLVKRIVADIVREQEQVTRIQEALDSGIGGKQQRLIQSDLELAVSHLQDYVEELATVGCELKDSQMGLIDFVGRHQGRDVYLCWKLGEEQIGYFHEIDSGFAGRQPVSLLQEQE